MSGLVDEEAPPVTVQLPKDSGALVKYHHALGTRFPTGRSLDHLSDDTLVYLVGKHVAAFQYENPQHRFILKSPKTSEIVCFCVSPNRKYIALAERLVEGALQVNIYTQHTGSKVRSLEFKYLSKLPVVSMSFSTDNKYLATVTALPDVYIYLWQVDKSRLIGMIDVPLELTKVSISPWAFWTLCTTGPSTLKLWRLVDKQLKPTDPMPKRKDGSQSQTYRYTSHSWYDEDKLVAATEEGDILVVEDSELKKVLRAVHGEGMAISSVTNFARGFICGGDGGIISLFERTFDSTTYFKLLKRFSSPHHSRVVDLSLAPKEESVVALYNNNMLAALSLENIELQKDSDAGVYTPLSVGYHNDVVTCVDVCVQKSIIMTGSLDKSIRVWNYLRRRVEFVKTFDEEVLSLSLHPTGLRVVVGFRSYMRMFNVLAHDLHFCTEFPVKPCYEVRFSVGGHLFAAVQAHRVLVFNTYDFQCIAQLSGHTVMIRSVSWSQSDQFLTSADLNGVIYTWQLDGQKRSDTDDIRKNVSYTCVRCDDSTGMTAAMGTCRVAEGGMAEGEVTIRCIVPEHEARVLRPGMFVTKLPSQRKTHTAEIALSTLSQTLFVGAPNGSLLLYRWPITDDAQPYQRHEVHNGEIAFVLLSRDERYLFTVGDDNTMFMFEVEAIVDGRSVSRKPFNFATFDDVCYTLQNDVDERTRELGALQQELEDLTASKARDEATLVQKFEADRFAKEEEARGLIDQLRRQLDHAIKAKEESAVTLVENSRHVESMHLKAAEELEALYTKRTEEANARYQQLKTERDDLIVRYENKLFKLQKEQEADRKRLDDKNREIEMRLTAELDQLKKRLVSDGQVSEAMLDQTIADYEAAVDELNSKYKQQIVKKEEDLSRAINNGSTGERDANRLREEKQLLLHQLQERDRQIAELGQMVEKRKKENDSLRKEMLVRFESISTAEKKIQQLKKQTTELEKLRYVLTFKFNELKKEVAPKDKQISFMTSRVEEMDHELEKVALDREALKQALDRKEDKLHVLHNEIGSEQRQLADKERVVNVMLRELTELLATSDPKQLVYRLKDVVQRYNTKQQRDELVVEEDRTAEFERQREYMEAQLGCVKRQNKQKEANMRLENQRNTAENAILVKEINELRHEKKVLTNKCQMVELQLKEARLALQRATAASAPDGGGGRGGLGSSAPAGAGVGGSSGRLSGGGGAHAARSGGDDDDDDAALPASRRGRLIRGPTRALRDIAQLDADKISRIIAQIERNNGEMERQEQEISRLREFVAHLLTRAESDRPPTSLSAEEQARHGDIRRHLQQTMTPVAGLPR